MKTTRNSKPDGSNFKRAASLIMFAVGVIRPTIQPAQAAPNLIIWDTGARLAEAANGENRTVWKAVPSELFAFEADPLKAASDPGYYGREYSFKGDAVVENRSLVAVFLSEKGRVTFYSKGDMALPDGASSHSETHTPLS